MFSSLSLFFQWGVLSVKFLWHLLAPYYSKKQPCLKTLKKVESLYIKKLPRCFFLVLGTKIRIFELARSLIEPNNFWTRLCFQDGAETSFRILCVKKLNAWRFLDRIFLSVFELHFSLLIILSLFQKRLK